VLTGSPIDLIPRDAGGPAALASRAPQLGPAALTSPAGPVGPVGPAHPDLVEQEPTPVLDVATRPSGP